ncbi:Hypothetical predicted protein [Pelobates cultripes]|uniref:Uncharacterized protein n=1 Tax=Pelobates cultripes TaxID=61616 RepID=A0AAD1W827_PELCU|nr:Hypothetical predicted protein [Pelobates cultripes]
MFQAPKDHPRPYLSQGRTDSGSESDEGERHENPNTPLTKWDLRQLLQEATCDIKAYTAAELDKHITNLRSTTKNSPAYMIKYNSWKMA